MAILLLYPLLKSNTSGGVSGFLKVGGQVVMRRGAAAGGAFYSGKKLGGQLPPLPPPPPPFTYAPDHYYRSLVFIGGDSVDTKNAPCTYSNFITEGSTTYRKIHSSLTDIFDTQFIVIIGLMSLPGLLPICLPK